MDIKEIKVYKTSDDKIFTSKEKADAHQEKLDKEAKIEWHIFRVTVTQQFCSNYEIETDQGLEAARDQAYNDVKFDLKQVSTDRNRTWDGWESRGDLEVLKVEEESEYDWDRYA